LGKKNFFAVTSVLPDLALVDIECMIMSQNSRSIVMNSDSLRPWKKEYSQPRVSWRKQTGSLNEMRRKIKAYIHL